MTMPKELKPLNITRELNEDTRKQGLWIDGKVYSLHIKDDEFIITDNHDYTKIYRIESLSFAYLNRLTPEQADRLNENADHA